MVAEETSGSEEYVCYLECGDGSMGVHRCQTVQIDDRLRKIEVEN